ncbi:MAG: Lrp/AsnC family transcriptional regulator [Thermoanaerobaculum sp.]|nr:Lrp/AsnC family transcriptional regulator [Thermoanaerobaculum sp.]MCX7894356.1 Lrp/AsnC family transcriptional regulator [Thermoanaerobaculum sp.]MDW7966825.1 Lrp/AsnC family transcriptional regulator [Thermoanaerobaculum sp.]
MGQRQKAQEVEERKVPLDRLDLWILRYLHENARVSLTAVARRLGVALATVHRRVQKLRAAGVIKGYLTRLEPQAFGFTLTAFVRLKAADREDLEERLASLGRFPEVEEIHLVTGSYDVLVKLRARDPQHLRRLLARIHAALGSGRARTEICLTSLLERCAPLYATFPGDETKSPQLP